MTIFVIARFEIYNSQGTQNTEIATDRCSTKIALWKKHFFDFQFFKKCGQNPWKLRLNELILVHF